MSDEVKTPKYPILDNIEVAEREIENWQVTVDMLAEIADIPAALIMRVHAHEIEVFVASNTPGNVYHPGEKALLGTGLYCEKVMSSRRQLLVPNALKDPEWDHNPDISLGMISYCGLPLTWPSGEIFGTICILDNKENTYLQQTHHLMERFRDSIQFSLENIYNSSAALNQAEETLRESDKKYRSLFESSRDAVMTLEPPSWKFTFGNPATVAMFGARSEEHFVSLGPWELSPEQQPDGRPSAEEAREMIETAMREGSIFFDWTHQRINGQTFPATVLLSRVELDGKVFLQATVRDITGQKRIEQAIIRAKDEWERTFDSIEDPIMILDTNYRVLRANKAMAEKLAVTPPAVVGLTCFKHVHGTDEPPEFCPHAQLLSDGKSHSAEIYEDRLCGYYNVSVAPLYAPDGTLYGSVHIARDITERKKADDMLRESEEKFRTYIEQAPVAVFVSDLDGRFLDCNPAATDILGYQAASLKKMSIHNIYYEEEREDIQRALETLKQSGYVEGEFRVKRSDGSCIWVLLNICEIKGALALGYCRDITGRKQAEEELNKYRDHLEELVKARTAEIEQKNAELERMNKLFVGRELRMVELKEKIRELEGQLEKRTI